MLPEGGIRQVQENHRSEGCANAVLRQRQLPDNRTLRFSARQKQHGPLIVTSAWLETAFETLGLK